MMFTRKGGKAVGNLLKYECSFDAAEVLNGKRR
jgi:hypothetical protein